MPFISRGIILLKIKQKKGFFFVDLELFFIRSFIPTSDVTLIVKPKFMCLVTIVILISIAESHKGMINAGPWTLPRIFYMIKYEDISAN